MQLEEIGQVEDFTRLARELYAAPDEIQQLQLAVDLAVQTTFLKNARRCSPAEV